jgi:hypothetical protein
MPSKDRRRWTVLIYMVADDPQGGKLLDKRAIKEMDQITKAALSVTHGDDIRVALQIDFRTLPQVWRRVIGEDTFVRPESNAADPATLYGFFDWAVTECPAEHYLLIFWGHSRGQFGIFNDPDPFDYTAQTLTIEELREALAAAKRSLQKPVDVIAFKDCFMANLETAYELSGLADYMLASPGLVPVEGWPYEEIFNALNDDKATKSDQPTLEAAGGILRALGDYYAKEVNGKRVNVGGNKEVAYSLLSTAGAVPVINALKAMIGDDRPSVDKADAGLRKSLDAAARAPGDRALADLGQLVQQAATTPAKPTAKPAATILDPGTLAAFVETLGNAKPKGTPGHGVTGKPRGEPHPPNNSKGLVIDHTGEDFGGVTVFVYPADTKDQRDSMLTRLADEQAYRRLAISTDTKWADIALRQMPIQHIQPAQDVSKGIALLEQLQRLGVGMDSQSAARASNCLRRRARLSRSGEVTEADVAEASQYATIAELAVRLADFASDKGGANFSDKGGANFSDKGGANFSDKGGANFSDKGGANFGPC